MKILTRLAIPGLVLAMFNSCFDPPQYSIVPNIEYQDIEFVEVGDFSDADTILLYINFRDGDGDLGLAATENSDPYHDSDYFLEDGTGGLIRVPTEVVYSDIPGIIKLSGQQGKLATVRTRNKPGYSYLPTFDRNGCPRFYTHNGVPDTAYYKHSPVYVSEVDAHIIDDTYYIEDTLESANFPDLYVVHDTVYYEPNIYHNNIQVDWLVKNNDGTFSVFDWTATMPECGPVFEGRFPVLEDKTRAVEGTLRYSMTSTGFLQLFSIKTLKLRISIWDRSLHQSNIIETRQFTLNDIRKG